MTRQKIIFTSEKLTLLFVFFLIGTLTALLYSQGLNSGFYLDDFSNLEKLEKINTRNGDGILAFLFDNENRRILSYLTFLPQYNDWISGNPYPLKLANLVIHLFNSLLVCIFSMEICKKLNLSKKDTFITISLCALLWSISPIHINSVLYTIQRMTLLSGTFILSACILFMKNSQKKSTNTEWLANACILGVFYFFGILCKENSILIGIHLAVIIGCFYHNSTPPKWWILLVIIMPLALLIFLIAYTHQLHFTGRDFSLTQRLITEPKILFDYFRKIILALPSDISLYYDNYPFFESLTANKIAILYLAAIFSSVILAVFFRTTKPVFSFAVLWFLGGHLLESTIIPLELYFEHRNYIPSLGIYFAIAFTVATSKKYKVISYLAVTLLIINAFITCKTEVESWSNHEKFALDAIMDHPESTRALQTAAQFFLSKGDIQKAALLIQHTQQIKPYAANLIYLSAFKCLDERVTVLSMANLQKEIKSIGYDKYIKDAIHNLFNVRMQHECPSMPWQEFQKLLTAIAELAPTNDKNYFIMHYVFTQQINNDPTILDKIRSINIVTGTLDQAFFKVYMLLEFGQLHEAAENLDEIERRFANTKSIYIYNNEIIKLKHLINKENNNQ